MIRLGIIGYNEGNGHPFSHAAIVNGFDEGRLREAGWGVIADYLVAGADQIGGLDAHVTAAWTPDPTVTRHLQDVAAIPHAPATPAGLLRHVDAVLVLRDDWSTHAELALPFLERGVPTFVDKPLTLDRGELDHFAPHLLAGRLASWSGLRFSPELDSLRGRHFAHVDASTVLDWDRYGLHAVEPALTLVPGAVEAVEAPSSTHEHVRVRLAGGVVVEVHARGAAGDGFTVQALDQAGARFEVRLEARATAFRRSLATFVRTVEDGRPVIAPAETMRAIGVLIAGRRALDGA